MSSSQFEALAGLEQRVVAADGGRLKLEWGSLRSRSGTAVHDLLWWAEQRLVGFLGLYAFGSPVELVGMVDPSVRRCGIGGALLDAGLSLCREQGHARALLVVPRASVGGHELARRRGGVLDHSEHALALQGPPPVGPADPTLTLRPAVPSDAPAMAALLEEGFGQPAGDVAEQLTGQQAAGDARYVERSWLVERDGRVVGTVRLHRHGDEAGVYGFVIDPELQGRGIGRDVLRRVCQHLQADGVDRVGLEVEVDNDRALGLYTSLGFEPVTTEDYYAFDLG